MKPRILIVEDEPGIADTLQYALRTDGFEPAWVATGAEAVAQAKAQPPALVILDVGLPDTSGFEVFKRLREGSDVPVIFLTARSDEIDRVVGLELGADDYVAKPFSPRELVARVRSILRRSNKPAAAASTAGCWSSRATSSACCRRSPRARATCFRATRCSTACGTTRPRASTAPSTPTSRHCARR
jgi:two-component system catabolic regulation response regulator CreB